MTDSGPAVKAGPLLVDLLPVISMFWKRWSAESLNRMGTRLQDEGRETEAEQAYLRACKARPEWSAPWYNLGLVYKYQGRWADSARCNQRAAELAPENQGAWWNLGIAATALGDWTLARHAWRGCGLQVPDGEGPLALDFGSTPVRLDPRGVGEAVWCRRIEPARAIIRGVPLPASGHRAGDVVLHDGAPNGWRTSDGREYPVFDALQRLERSDHATCEAWIEAPSERDVDALGEAADDAGVALEDWTGSLRTLCRACSEGRPHENHDHELPAEWTSRRRIGLALRRMDDGTSLLRTWAADAPGRALVTITLAERGQGRGVPSALPHLLLCGSRRDGRTTLDAAPGTTGTTSS
jgi:hypothetical protein